MLNPLSASQRFKAYPPNTHVLKQKLRSQTITAPLLATALLSLLLTVSTSNQTLKQTGSAVALMAGGATAASLSKKDPQREIEQLQANHQRREAALKTALDLAMSDSKTHSEQLTQINEALVSWEDEKIHTTNQIEKLKWQQHQLIGELYEIAIAENTLHTQATDRQVTAQARITELETALAAKTNLATQMLTELETEATDTFNQFNAKITAQNNLIQELRQQIEILRKPNTIPPENHLERHSGSPLERSFSSIGQNTRSTTPLQSASRTSSKAPAKNTSDNRVFGRQKMSRAS